MDERQVIAEALLQVFRSSDEKLTVVDAIVKLSQAAEDIAAALREVRNSPDVAAAVLAAMQNGKT